MENHEIKDAILIYLDERKWKYFKVSEMSGQIDGFSALGPSNGYHKVLPLLEEILDDGYIENMAPNYPNDYVITQAGVDFLHDGGGYTGQHKQHKDEGEKDEKKERGDTLWKTIGRIGIIVGILSAFLAILGIIFDWFVIFK